MSIGKWMIIASVMFAVVLALLGVHVATYFDEVVGLLILLSAIFPFANVLFWSRVTIQWAEE